MPRYKVICSEIEWDVTEDDCEDYDINVVKALPKSETVIVQAPNEDCARDWAMDEISDNNSFCIQGCKIKIENVPEGY